MVDYVTAELSARADPAAAPLMAAYMKTDMPFYGVKQPGRAPIARYLGRHFAPVSDRDFEEKTRALWGLPHREEKYLAVDYARAFRSHLTMRHVGLFESMITEGAWWDLVDDLASRHIGTVLATEREAMTPILWQWIDHDDLWLRRTALLAQLRHKHETDRDMLFAFCLRRAHEREFFIRKAIGWALRDYARTDPAWVRSFVDARADRLSPLSIREATRHLDRP